MSAARLGPALARREFDCSAEGSLMIHFPIERLLPIEIVAIIEPNAAKGAYSFNYLLDTIRNWRGFGYRFIVKEHVHKPGSITPELIANADQLWFFGTELCEENSVFVSLIQPEIDAIEARMNDGVGVFATGDHENIGSGLCGKIPRAGKMRIWNGSEAPTRNRPKSFESSVRSPYRDVIDPARTLDLLEKCDESDENDTLPKVIWTDHFPGQSPHELFQLSTKQGADKRSIQFLPDHMHEGKLLDYDELDAAGVPLLPVPVEFYPGSKPRIAARAVRSVFDGNGKPANGVSYPVVSVYEPPPESGWGNVVVDSTFHHWTDFNALRLRYSPAWFHVEQYAINMANWLLGEKGRKKVKAALLSYLTEVAPGAGLAPETPAAENKKINFLDLANRAGKLMIEHRIVGDTLERLLRGNVDSADPAKEMALMADLRGLKKANFGKLRADGNLQRVVLGLEVRRLQLARAQPAA